MDDNSSSNKRRRIDDSSRSASVAVGEEEETVHCVDDRIHLQEEDFTVKQVPLVRHGLLHGKTDVNLRWTERIASYFYPTSSFAFEVNYTPAHRDLMFSYQWQYLPYSGRCPNRFLLYCVVSHVPATFTQVIAAGDIIVKVNEDPFFYMPGDSVDYSSLENRLKNFVATAKGISTIRFYRPGGVNPSSFPSVAELKLMAHEKNVPPVAKFIVKTNTKGEPFVENTSMEPTIPVIVKKMLTGQKIGWHNIPVLDAGPATALSNLTTMNNIPFASTISTGLTSLSVFPDQLGDVVKSCVFKDRLNKYHAIFVDEDSEPIYDGKNSNPIYQHYYLGRYEKEEDANKVLLKAQQVRETSGKFNIRHYLLNYKEPEPPAPEPKAEDNSSSGNGNNSSDITFSFSLNIPGFN